MHSIAQSDTRRKLLTIMSDPSVQREDCQEGWTIRHPLSKELCGNYAAEKFASLAEFGVCLRRKGHRTPVLAGRLEAFSDGVIAIIITIMVLEMKAPHGDTLTDLLPVLPVFLSYVLSFVYVGIYWNNHHHLLHATTTVTGGILWANLHLLFWLSLFPFATAWVGQNHFSARPMALYGVILLMAALAYYLLQQTIIRSQGANSVLKRAVGNDWKGKLSPLFYIAAILTAFVEPWISAAILVGVAMLWLVPDRRIEKALPSGKG